MRLSTGAQRSTVDGARPRLFFARFRLQTPGQRPEGPKAISYQPYEENARHNIS